MVLFAYLAANIADVDDETMRCVGYGATLENGKKRRRTTPHRQKWKIQGGEGLDFTWRQREREKMTNRVSSAHSDREGKETKVRP